MHQPVICRTLPDRELRMNVVVIVPETLQKRQDDLPLDRCFVGQQLTFSTHGHASQERVNRFVKNNPGWCFDS